MLTQDQINELLTAADMLAATGYSALSANLKAIAGQQVDHERALRVQTATEITSAFNDDWAGQPAVRGAADSHDVGCPCTRCSNILGLR